MPVTKTRKIVVLGFQGVGKSAVVVRFVDDMFADSYSPTIANAFQKNLRFRGQDYQMEIIDTAGQDEFSPFHQNHALDVHGYVLVYSVASRQTFECIRGLNDKILDSCGCDKVPRILVGNKTDLMVERQVSVEEGRRLAEELGTAFIECSAKKNDRIAESFKKLLTEIEKHHGAPKEKEEDNCVIL
mmetsp:Transcript_19281/g.54120  ORF Transcript_19281/g.54120 Transcript_19281/m.54120 type:complete len:186 (-) Transcript_19281:197-754(-)